ncbi:MAG: DUF4298 domain-containing protein [Clostridia bacterium]|nr:DUF4298 domain-containing protein [Clostridia bacterium]
MNFSENIQRIKRMEIYYDTVFNTVHNAPELLNDEHISAMLKSLAEYYEGGQWLKDYEADERGEIPKDLKRGVLAQDAIYDLLHDVDEAKKLFMAPLDDLPIIFYNRYIEIGDIKSFDKGEHAKTIEIYVGSAIIDKNIKRRSVMSVLNETEKICKGKKAEFVFKSCEGGKWDALDWAHSVYLIIFGAMERNIFGSLIVYTNKTADELSHPDIKNFRSEQDMIRFQNIIRLAEKVITL